MLLYHLDVLFKCTIVLILLVLICAITAYYVNSKRSIDDPKKKDYHPAAIVFALFTFPFVLVLSISFYILWALTYGVFLCLFIFALIFLRKPFILAWLQKIATAIGDRLLEANMLFIKLFMKPWAEGPKRT